MRPRFNLYRDTHKSIRMYLSEFSLVCGRCDFADQTDLSKLKSEFKNIHDMFLVHTKVEDDHVLPQIKMFDLELYKKFEETHHKVDDDMGSLKSDLESIASADDNASQFGYEFYLKFNRFCADNLNHLDDEEKKAMPLLWENMTDEELIACFARIRADIPPPLMQSYLSYMIPSLKLVDLSMILKAVQATAPPEKFENVKNLALRKLGDKDYKTLESYLN